MMTECDEKCWNGSWKNKKKVYQWKNWGNLNKVFH